ncbi:hypothetical protein [Methylotenera sp.]|uniref:hypothetical protein n=1 Tax=Methylotenera sp. TaxID=2051956 RepID=UPI0035201A76
MRKGAPEAALLYAETQASIAKRENAKATGEGEHALRDRGRGDQPSGNCGILRGLPMLKMVIFVIIS